MPLAILAVIALIVCAIAYYSIVIKAKYQEAQALLEADTLAFMSGASWTTGKDWKYVAEQLATITQADFDAYSESQQALINKILSHQDKPVLVATPAPIVPVITPLIMPEVPMAVETAPAAKAATPKKPRAKRVKTELPKAP